MDKSCANCKYLQSDVTKKPCSICGNPIASFNKWEPIQSIDDKLIDIMNTDKENQNAWKIHIAMVSLNVTSAKMTIDGNSVMYFKSKTKFYICFNNLKNRKAYKL
jgi:RNA polymerase subunit RPABC4/transcription elongation factor Spt4